jgi:hypothetical protein
MSQFSRFIEVDINLVFFDPEDDSRSITIDCSSLKQKNIKFVCEEDGVMWIEEKPFTGRVYDFDRAEVDDLFQRAEDAWTEENDRFMNSLDVTPEIAAYYGMLAVDQMGYATQFYGWSTAPERSPQEKTFFNYKLVWRRDDQILIDCLVAIGFDEQKIDDLFELAVNL